MFIKCKRKACDVLKLSDKTIKRINILMLLSHTAVLIYYILLSNKVVQTIKPLPTSDFIYYWNLASDLSIYHKGGIIGFIYAPFKALGIAPYNAAWLVNTLFLILVYLVTWFGLNQSDIYKSDINQSVIKQVLIQILSTFGFSVFALWNTGYAGMVNADFPNVALILAFVRFMSLYFESKDKRMAILSGLFLFLAVALRVKTGLALGIMTGATIVFYFSALRRDIRVKVLILTVCVAVGFAAITEIMLRAQSDRPLDVARQGRLQLYTGLLYTETGNMCGRWTREAFDKTLEEINDPLLTVINRHLSVKSKAYLLSIVGCKLQHVIEYDEFSFRELLAFGVKHRSYTEADLEIVRKYEKVEESRVIWFKWLTLIVSLLLIIRHKFKGRNLSYVPVFIYGAFMILHSVFEIQARYMAEPLLWTFFVAIIIFKYETEEVSKLG